MTLTPTPRYRILQTDIQRLAGMNEYLVVCLMARKFGTKVRKMPGWPRSWANLSLF